MSRIDTHAFGLWWKLAKGWFSTKFESINFDISELSKQGDNEEATNTAILEAVDNIELDTSDLAKEETLNNFRSTLMGESGVLTQYAPYTFVVNNPDAQSEEDSVYRVLITTDVSTEELIGYNLDNPQPGSLSLLTHTPEKGETISYPFAPSNGAEVFYPSNLFHYKVCTQAPTLEQFVATINSVSDYNYTTFDGWVFMEIEQGSTYTCLRKVDYTFDGEYLGSVWVYEKSENPSEITLADILNAIRNISAN